MTPLHTQSRGWMQSRSMMQMHTMVEAVLTLPDHPAAMTRPLSTAIIRRAETASSRAMTTTKIHAGIRPQLTNMDMADRTRTLSAMGSMNLPKSVTWLR